MKDNTNNKEFWNNYVTYWERKVEEANKDVGAKDRTVDDKLLEIFFDKLNIHPNEKILDYGCGSCRLYRIYHQKIGMDGYIGVDVSRVSLEHAKNKYSELKIGNNLIEFDGNELPFPDNSFDKIMCFAVFDAVSQELVLQELLRVLKPEGMLLVTGKNNKYFSDDDEAMVAEINARKKEHPNSFTDVANMMGQLETQEVEVIKEFYYLKRCDFALNKYVDKRPDVFYNWALILKKTKNSKIDSFKAFSSHYSKTFIEMHQNDNKGET